MPQPVEYNAKGILLPGPVSNALDHCTMYLFRRPDYKSEVTLFIDALKKQHPELDAQQQAGRALLWDKQVDAEVQAQYRAGRVRQKPYVYQTNAD